MCVDIVEILGEQNQLRIIPLESSKLGLGTGLVLRKIVDVQCLEGQQPQNVKH